MDRELEEYIKWEERKSSPINNIVRNLSPISLVLLGIMILLAIYLLSKGDTRKNLIYLVIAVVVIVLLIRSKKVEERQPIPENIIKKMGIVKMRAKIGKDKELPWGTSVISTIYCKLRYEGSWGDVFKPFRWEVGYKIIKPNGLKTSVITLFHPYDGYITGILKAPAGYTGDTSHDLKIIPSGVVITDKGFNQEKKD